VASRVVLSSTELVISHNGILKGEGGNEGRIERKKKEIKENGSQLIMKRYVTRILSVNQ
jgi:hypothetical protein